MNSFDSYLSTKLKFENDDNFLLSKLLQKQYNLRPRVRDIIDTPWFNDPKLKALNFVMNLESNDQKKNVEFLEKLPKIIGMFENKIIIKRFLPALLKAIKVETLINPCLPAIFSICESPTFKIDFSREIWPKLKDLFKLRSLPAAAIYFLISKVQYIGEHISQSEFSQNFLNLICKALDCNVPKIQLVVSNNMKFIANNTDSLSFKNQIFPRMMQVVSSTNSKSLKISLLNNIKDLYTKLDQNLINDKLLATLEKVRRTDGNNDVCMCICDIYLEISKIVSLEGIANKILPNLISMLVTGNITKSNFDKIMGLITTYLDQVNDNNDEQINEDIEPGDFQMNNNNAEDEMVNNSQMLSKEQQNEYSMGNNDDTEHTCQFCGLFNPNFTSEQIDLHQYKECPMLLPCFKCKQIVEISTLNHHYLNECAQKKQFKQCPRCKEAVLLKDYEAHVADKSCNQFKSPTTCNRCPLCHNDVTPSGKVGWEIHLLEQMCPNNPRTSS